MKVVDPKSSAALPHTHEWFESNSGWAPPDPETLDDWRAEGVCRCPDDCLVSTGAVCSHGLVTWDVVLAALADEDRERGRRG